MNGFSAIALAFSAAGLVALVCLHGVDDAMAPMPLLGARAPARNLKAEAKSKEDPDSSKEPVPSKAKDAAHGTTSQRSRPESPAKKGARTDDHTSKPSKAEGHEKKGPGGADNTPSKSSNTEGKTSKGKEHAEDDSQSAASTAHAKDKKSAKVKERAEDDSHSDTSTGSHIVEDKLSHKKKRELPIYDEEGWHMPGKDFVEKVLHPDELQPFYIMPVFFAIKLMLTMLIFGFSLRFKEQTKNACVDGITCLGKTVASLAFMALAINGYYVDYCRMMLEEAEVSTTGERVGVLLVLWVTSSNYVACRAIWGSLAVENPVTLLGLKAKYIALPIVNIPLCPGGAKWLDPLKHLYALILFPYYIPYFVVSMAQPFVLLIWCCATKCAVCWGTIWASCSCSCALVGTILTLGLVAWTKNALGYWWTLEKPLYIQVVIQLWATMIAPFLFSLVFGILLCGSPKSILEGLQKGVMAAYFSTSGVNQGGSLELSLERSLKPEALAGQPPPPGTNSTSLLALSKDDAAALRQLNKEKLDDMDYAELPQDEEGTPGDVELEDSKMQIFHVTLTKMSSIVMEQLALIFIVRAMNEIGDYDHYIGALKRTLTERTLVQYVHHIHHLAEASSFKAANALSMLL